MSYLKSDEITVYPSGYRGQGYDYGSFVNTEENLNDIAGRLVKNKSYIVEETEDNIKFVVKGYLFSAKKSSIISLFSSASENAIIYADTTVISVTSGDGTFETLVPYNTSVAGVLDIQNTSNEYEFRGVEFSTTHSDGSLSLFKKTSSGWETISASRLIFDTAQIENNSDGKSIKEKFETQNIFADEATISSIIGSLTGNVTGNASTATNANNATESINGKSISSIFETNGTTVKNATTSNQMNGDCIFDDTNKERQLYFADNNYISGNLLSLSDCDFDVNNASVHTVVGDLVSVKGGFKFEQGKSYAVIVKADHWQMALSTFSNKISGDTSQDPELPEGLTSPTFFRSYNYDSDKKLALIKFTMLEDVVLGTNGTYTNFIGSLGNLITPQIPLTEYNIKEVIVREISNINVSLSDILTSKTKSAYDPSLTYNQNTHTLTAENFNGVAKYTSTTIADKGVSLYRSIPISVGNTAVNVVNLVAEGSGDYYTLTASATGHQPVTTTGTSLVTLRSVDFVAGNTYLIAVRDVDSGGNVGTGMLQLNSDKFGTNITMFSNSGIFNRVGGDVYRYLVIKMHETVHYNSTKTPLIVSGPNEVDSDTSNVIPYYYDISHLIICQIADWPTKAETCYDPSFAYNPKTNRVSAWADTSFTRQTDWHQGVKDQNGVWHIQDMSGYRPSAIEFVCKYGGSTNWVYLGIAYLNRSTFSSERKHHYLSAGWPSSVSGSSWTMNTLYLELIETGQSDLVWYLREGWVKYNAGGGIAEHDLVWVDGAYIYYRYIY